MEFTNVIQESTAIPHLPLPPFERLPAAYRKKRLWVAWMVVGTLLIAYAGAWAAWAWGVDGIQGVVLAWAGALVATASGLCFVAADVGYGRMSFLLRQHDLTFQSGWLFRTRTTVPVARIQHAEVHRGPLDRKLGLSSLRLYTAGSSGANLIIPGLEAEFAENLRESLMSRVHDP